MGYTLFSYSYFYAYLICRDPDGKYRGDWAWNEENDTGRGNPAMSPDVTDTLRAIKKKHGAEGVRNHSGAMSLPYLNRIYEWSLQQCPVSSPENSSVADHALIQKHLAWRAFSSFGWTLWTRYFLSVFSLSQDLFFALGTLKH